MLLCNSHFSATHISQYIVHENPKIVKLFFPLIYDITDRLLHLFFKGDYFFISIFFVLLHAP